MVSATASGLVSEEPDLPVEITPEMIRAGEEVLLCRRMEIRHPETDSIFAEVAADLYRAMSSAR